MSESQHPQNITPNLWYYEYPRRIVVLHRCPQCKHTDSINVPWHRLEKSLRRRTKRSKR